MVYIAAQIDDKFQFLNENHQFGDINSPDVLIFDGLWSASIYFRNNPSIQKLVTSFFEVTPAYSYN